MMTNAFGSRSTLLPEMAASPASLFTCSFPATPACPGQKIQVILRIRLSSICCVQSACRCFPLIFSQVERVSDTTMTCLNSWCFVHESAGAIAFCLHAWESQICGVRTFCNNNSINSSSKCPSLLCSIRHWTVCEDDTVVVIMTVRNSTSVWAAPGAHSLHSLQSVEMTCVKLRGCSRLLMPNVS